ncbi:hypothetical protein [Sorangium sp. So ce513]|uniref:hypothetical protein n=1 Tax=Sorangium sp. So ce513 TaxID=3133315 RepID=UPI003F636738
MIVVADTTPLLYLSRIDHLDIVREVHREILVPKTVWEELVVARPAERGVEALRSSPWIRVSDDVERAGINARPRKRRRSCPARSRGTAGQRRPISPG